MLSSKVTKIGPSVGVDYAFDVIIYSTKNHIAVELLTLEDESMKNLIEWYTDDLCPVCFKEIPLNDIVCDGCAANIAQVWEG